MRVQDCDISIMYWLTNWVTVGYNEIQTVPQQKCILMENIFTLGIIIQPKSALFCWLTVKRCLE